MIIGLDLGTTSLSAVLFDTHRQIATGSAECVNNAEVAGLPEGCHEQCPETIVETAYRLIARLIQETAVPPEKIKGLALTGQQHGLVAVDEKLNSLTNLITWRDQRTAAVPESLRRHPHAAETGCFLHAGYGGLTLHYLIGSGTLPAGTHKILSVTGFLAARLTGRCAEDETMAASWGLLDLKSGQWHRQLPEFLGISRALLPELVPSCRSLGPVLHPELSGLTRQTIVFSPAGDNQAGFAGVGNDGRQEAIVNLGTSSQISVFSRDCDFSPKLEIRPFPGGGFLRVHAALCGGWAYAYLAGFFRQVVKQIGGIEMPLSDVFDRMGASAGTAEADAIFADTRFAGERNGDAAFGSIGGLNTMNFTPANLTMAFACGIAGELAGAAQALRLDGISGLAVVGNAAHRNPLLVRALEKQFGLPCRLVASGREAALGAARLVVRLNEKESL